MTNRSTAPRAALADRGRIRRSRTRTQNLAWVEPRRRTTDTDARRGTHRLASSTLPQQSTTGSAVRILELPYSCSRPNALRKHDPVPAVRTYRRCWAPTSRHDTAAKMAMRSSSLCQRRRRDGRWTSSSGNRIAIAVAMSWFDARGWSDKTAARSWRATTQTPSPRSCAYWATRITQRFTRSPRSVWEISSTTIVNAACRYARPSTRSMNASIAFDRTRVTCSREYPRIEPATSCCLIHRTRNIRLVLTSFRLIRTWSERSWLLISPGSSSGSVRRSAIRWRRFSEMPCWPS